VTLPSDESLRFNPTETLGTTRNLLNLKDLQDVTTHGQRAAIVSKFLESDFLAATPAFSTISHFGNDLAPPASQGPKLKPLIRRHLASIWQFVI
jgi:hypothetical protein